jgi:hypothetical protein
MTVHAIRACVDPKVIQTVTRLFNQSEGDIAAEMLQNARRAGATRVIVSTTQLSHDRACLRISDNGRGIDDPAKLLRLGASGWDDETLRREDPAGMGVFSLAGRKVDVSSRAGTTMGWSAHIDEGDWTSGHDIEIHGCVRSPGTTFAIELSAGRLEDAKKAIANAARHYPVDVELNGEIIERQDFLANATHIEIWNGLRIGVFTDSRGAWRRTPSINFHGLTVNHTLPTIAEIDNDRQWCAKVDVIDCPALQLTLPARKEVVVSPFVDELAAAVRSAIYTAIAAQQHHRLSYENWCEAAVLGIILPNAKQGLRLFKPRAYDESLSSDYEPPTTIGDNLVLIDDLEAAEEQSLARALIASRDAIAGTLVRSEPAFKGYDWYDRLSQVESLRFIVKQGTAIYVDTLGGDLINLADRQVDAIAAELTIITDGLPQVHQLNTDLLLQPDENYDLDGASIAVVKGGVAGAEPLTPTILAEYLDNAYFCHSDDSNCDSFDTQLRYWQKDSRHLAVRTLLGDDEAVSDSILQAFLDSVAWLVPQGSRLWLHHEKGETTISLEPAAADPAAPPVA